MSSINDKLNKLKQIKDELKNVLVKHDANPTDDFTTYPSVFDKVIEDSKSGAAYTWPEYFDIKTNNGTDGSYLYYRVSRPNTSNALNVNEYVNHFKNFTTVEYMFGYCFYQNKDYKDYNIIMQNADFSNVTSMSYMLDHCGYINGNNTVIDLSGIKTSSNLVNLSYLCYYSSVKTLNISGINTSYVTNMNYMFYQCKKLEEVIGEIDCSRLSNGLYPSSSSHPFISCNSLKRITLKNIYKNCTLTNASKWSINLSSTKLETDCLISIMNELPTLPTGYTNIVLTLPPTNTLTDEQKQIAINKNWTVVN